MVWFQCEDCGENLKKPKLPNHFRICSAYKLSCIDCGEIFDRETVQAHNQCITEAEKYGPKGQSKFPNGSTPKANTDTKSKPQVDINVGLSDRPPWVCSLCNTKATSKQTLLLHADGKKHRAKARAFHAAQQPKPSEVQLADANATNDCKADNGTLDNGHAQEQNGEDETKADTASANLEEENGKLLPTKKRKHKALGDEINGEKAQKNASDEIHLKKAKQNAVENKNGVANGSGDCSAKKIKWKKLIKSALKSNPDGALKLKKLKKMIMKSLKKSGVAEGLTEFDNTIEQKVSTCSRFKVDGKNVCLVAKD